MRAFCVRKLAQGHAGIFLPGWARCRVSKAVDGPWLWSGVTKGFWFKDRAKTGAGVLAADFMTFWLGAETQSTAGLQTILLLQDKIR